MTDPLLACGQLTIEESRQLKLRARALKAEQEHELERLRLAVFDSAMLRSESKACRDNRK